jgi:hypothetical protein
VVAMWQIIKKSCLGQTFFLPPLHHSWWRCGR